MFEAMTGHYIYIAASDDLMTWTKEKFDRFAIKVGESANPAEREGFLGGRNELTGASVRACCGFGDWKIVARRLLSSKDEAQDLEARFKAKFDKLNDFVRGDPDWRRSTGGNGESDVLLLPHDIFHAGRGDLDLDVRDLLIAGRSNMFSAVKPTKDPEPRVLSDREEERERVRKLYEQDERDQGRENMDRAAALHEDGSYYT